jgi:oligopeptide transport system ATP-binding protein
MVFQDPLGSLDPRMRVGDIVGEPLRTHRAELAPRERSALVDAMLARVALPADSAHRFAHEFSGGQCQRIAIARAMVLAPRLLVCDEPVSALDVSVQAQILDLLARLARDHGTAMLFVSHNLLAVRRLCQRALVLYRGRMMELVPASQLPEAVRHPYTRALFDAVPRADPRTQPARFAAAAEGEPPVAAEAPAGCVFHDRCPHATAVCRERAPQWEEAGVGHCVACHHWRRLVSS